MNQSVTSSEGKLAHSMVEMQCMDPACITIPNMCANELIQLEDKTATRCFSVALCRPHDLPPDRWELVKLPHRMPKLSGARKGLQLDAEHVMVDHITLGLFNNNRLQGVFNEKGGIIAMKMFPPDGVDDASEYWADAAQELDSARKQGGNLIKSAESDE
tara:strand:+ start:90 stop:566 length:477 start_codon:yes stop_codon:yes gene_type:complete